MTSLERLRPYAAELGYEAPAAEEERIWGIFDAQTTEMKRGMVERRQSTRHDQSVAEALLARGVAP